MLHLIRRRPLHETRLSRCRDDDPYRRSKRSEQGAIGEINSVPYQGPTLRVVDPPTPSSAPCAERLWLKPPVVERAAPPTLHPHHDASDLIRLKPWVHVLQAVTARSKSALVFLEESMHRQRGLTDVKREQVTHLIFVTRRNHDAITLDQRRPHRAALNAQSGSLAAPEQIERQISGPHQALAEWHPLESDQATNRHARPESGVAHHTPSRGRQKDHRRAAE